MFNVSLSQITDILKTVKSITKESIMISNLKSLDKIAMPLFRLP